MRARAPNTWRFGTKLKGEEEVEVKLPVGEAEGEVKLSVVLVVLFVVEVAVECAFMERRSAVSSGSLYKMSISFLVCWT